LQRDARLFGNPTRRRQDLIDLWVMRLFSQGIGAVVSLALFAFVVTAVFKPAYLALLASVETPPVVVEEASVDPAIRYRVMILQPPPPPTFNPDRHSTRMRRCSNSDRIYPRAARSSLQSRSTTGAGARNLTE
jgi:hypothetical protein